MTTIVSMREDKAIPVADRLLSKRTSPTTWCTSSIATFKRVGDAIW